MIMLQKHSVKPQLSCVVAPYKIFGELQRHTTSIRWEKLYLLGLIFYILAFL